MCLRILKDIFLAFLGSFVTFVFVLNKCRVCSAMNMPELGCSNLIKMDAIEKPCSVPKFSKPYKGQL